MPRGVLKRQKPNVENDLVDREDHEPKVTPGAEEARTDFMEMAYNRWNESRSDFIKRVATDLLIEIIKQPGMANKTNAANLAHERAVELAGLLELKD